MSSQQNAITRAVRVAVETATVQWSHEAGNPSRQGEVRFATEGRSALQAVAKSSRSLEGLAQACELEMQRQIMEVESTDGAFAAIKLKESLAEIARPRRTWVMDSDGNLVPLEDQDRGPQS